MLKKIRDIFFRNEKICAQDILALASYFSEPSQAQAIDILSQLTKVNGNICECFKY